MNQQLFIETIKVKDGRFYNLPLHLARLQKTAKHFFKTVPQLNLSSDMIPEEMKTGLLKCRVMYNQAIVSIDFEPYVFKKIDALTVVDGQEIDYPYKSAERASLNNLLLQKGNGDDVLIVKKGLITDTSYTNVVLERAGKLYTPQSYLLGGIKRESLLKRGAISEIVISLSDISAYSTLYLINAMIDLEDEICVSIDRLIF